MPEKKTNPQPTPRKRAKRRQPSRRYSAGEKARAVLAIWTEKLSQSDICREMEINYMTLQNWQKR
ncbi:transposase, partial [Haloferula sp. A504]|uniref:transposase n=1 Tax=Haloferula sp. A504 TaxID=3373601 RepID=UPI003789D405